MFTIIYWNALINRGIDRKTFKTEEAMNEFIEELKKNPAMEYTTK